MSDERGETTARNIREFHKMIPALREFARYFAVSLISLTVDVGLLLVLAKVVHYAIAATASFLVGAVVHYLLSIHFVFRQRRLLGNKLAELLIFLSSGVAALVVNVGVIAFCVEFLSMPLAFSKLVAAGFSFIFGYAMRKAALF